MKIATYIISTFLCLFVCCFTSTGQQSIKILNYEQKASFHHLLLERLDKQFEMRKEALEMALKNKEDLFKRQDFLRESYKKLLGEQPKKCPLNPIVMGIIDCDTYTIEKVVYESRPNFHITANFYLPKNRKGKIPGIYIMSGHSSVGKATETYHIAATLFAINGFAVLLSDPICQGERFQKIATDGSQFIPGPTTNHTLLDVSSMLVGSDIVSYELWDNVVSIDYLASRPEVDNSRLGITGNSGGGTQVTYLAEFDDRIKAIAPACYIASFETKFKGIGSQDGCQQLHDEGLYGLEEQDLLFLAAPKPIRILSAESDFFAIDGALKAAEELQRIYTCLGMPERTDIVHVPGKHGFSRPLREASVAWMKRWLMNDTVIIKEHDNLTVFSPEELRVTPTGQVLSYFQNERMLTDINIEKLMNLYKYKRNAYTESYSDLLHKVKMCIHYEGFDSLKISVKSNGHINAFGFNIEQLLISRLGEYQLPGLLFRPQKENKKTEFILLLDDQGKDNEITNDGLIRKELEKGNIVLSVDLSNWGELLFKPGKYMNDGFYDAYLALYNGKPLITWQLEDILSSIVGIKNFLNKAQTPITLIAKGIYCPVAVHAAFFSKHIKRVELVKPAIRNWKDLVRNPFIKNGLSFIIPDALTVYDLSDLEKHIKNRILIREYN